MVAKPFYLLRLQKYIKAKQTFLKEKKNIPCLWEIFQKIFQPITLKRQD